MRSLSRTWPPTTDRYARMRKRAATVADPKALPSPFIEFPGTVGAEEIERFQQAWDEMIAADGARHRQIIHVPGRFTFTPRPLRRTPRGVPRMRAHTSRTLEVTKRHLNGRWQRVLTYRIRAGVVSPDELRASLGPPLSDGSIDFPLPLKRPTFDEGETASARFARLLRWAGFATPPERVEVTYVGPEFPRLAMAALDERAVTDNRTAAANRLIEDHCAPHPDTDPEQDPHA